MSHTGTTPGLLIGRILAGLPDDSRNRRIEQTARQLEDAAAVIRTIAPSTRFWINFSVPELEWAQDADCPIRINQPYIDVISLCSYWGTFGEVAGRHYTWLQRNRATPYQQLALVPGTFFRDGADDQRVRAAYLNDYFEFANQANQTCDLPLGRARVTGNWDGCLVWIVAGWSALTFRIDEHVWRGVSDPASRLISEAWTAEFTKPVRSPLLGYVESYDPEMRTFYGWAVDRNSLDSPPYVDLWLDGQHSATTIAHHYRADIGQRYGEYRSGFSIQIPDSHADGRCRTAHIYAVASSAAPHNHLLLPSATGTRVCP